MSAARLSWPWRTVARSAVAGGAIAAITLIFSRAVPVNPTTALRPEDVETLHRLWLDVTADPAFRHLHHHQLLTVALRRLAADLRAEDRDLILGELKRFSAADRGVTGHG